MAQDAHIVTRGVFLEQGEVELAVGVLMEHSLPVVASLSDVMQQRRLKGSLV